MKSDQAKPHARRPYEAPRVTDTKVFETLALSCGKLANDGSGERGQPACMGRTIGAS